MPRSDLYTLDEVMLCTYAAMYNADDFGGLSAIHSITKRSVASIQMKISNIVAMLDEESIPRNRNLSALSGVPNGQSGRRTNWPWVEPLTRLPRQELLRRCRNVL